MVERKQYLQELKQWKDDDVIKVVTGLRRCGKSTLLAQFQNWLLENGIENEQIISINFEELECTAQRHQHQQQCWFYPHIVYI